MSAKHLSVHIARRFLEHPASVNLSRFESVEDAAADVLSTYTFGLELDGLTSLSDAAAESLGKQGEPVVYELTLNGLSCLSEQAAEALSRHEGGLELNGVTSLSNGAVAGLSGLELAPDPQPLGLHAEQLAVRVEFEHLAAVAAPIDKRDLRLVAGTEHPALECARPRITRESSTGRTGYCTSCGSDRRRRPGSGGFRSVRGSTGRPLRLAPLRPMGRTKSSLPRANLPR